MKISKLFAQRRPLFSFEFFPPKTEAGAASLARTMRDLRGSGAGLRLRDLRRGRLDARPHGRAGHAHAARGRHARHGPPDRGRRDPRRDRRAGRSSGRRRHREPDSAAGRPAGRTHGFRRRPAAASPTPRSWWPSSASATATVCAWPAPAIPRGTRSAATSTATWSTWSPRSRPGSTSSSRSSSSTTATTSTSWRARARPASRSPSSPASCPSPTLPRSSASPACAAPACRLCCCAELERRRGRPGRHHAARPRAGHRPMHRPHRRWRARHPLLHAQPVAGDAHDPDRPAHRQRGAVGAIHGSPGPTVSAPAPARPGA